MRLALSALFAGTILASGREAKLVGTPRFGKECSSAKLSAKRGQHDAWRSRIGQGHGAARGDMTDAAPGEL